MLKKFVAIISLFAGFQANAGIVFTLEGVSGSSDFTYSVGGSYNHSGVYTSGNNSGQWFRIPLNSGSWFAPTWAWSTTNGITSSMGIISGTGSFNFEVSGDLFGTYNYSDLYAITGFLEPYQSVVTNPVWMDLGASDSVAIAGSGSIDFTAVGWTYDDLTAGSYDFTGGTGQDTLTFVIREAAAAPEPSIIALFAAGLFGIGFARRRQS